jgi:hypothetical protein
VKPGKFPIPSAILFTLFCGSASADSSGTLIVSAKSNIFAAGRASAFNGALPPSIRFTPGAGQVLTFSSVTGTVTASPTSGANGPDGGAGLPTNINSYQGISGIVHTTSSLFLVGVFLDDSTPADPAPSRFTFTDDSFTSLSPALRQVFFIGDGHTPGGTLHQFNVPATATRLFLGFADAYAFQGAPGYYDDNGGSFTATCAISLSCTHSINPTSRSVGAEGGTFTVAVSSSPSACSWSCSTTFSWLSIVSGCPGQGSRDVTYRVEPNTGIGRVGTLVIAGQIHTVTQAVAPWSG